MSELTSMMNIGREMERKLISVGIESHEELIETGVKKYWLWVMEILIQRGLY